MSEIYLMATICNRKNIPRFVKFYADARAEVGTYISRDGNGIK